MTHVGSITKIYKEMVEQSGYNAASAIHLYDIIVNEACENDSIEPDDGSEEEDTKEMSMDEFILLEKFKIHPLKDYA